MSRADIFSGFGDNESNLNMEDINTVTGSTLKGTEYMRWFYALKPSYSFVFRQAFYVCVNLDGTPLNKGHPTKTSFAAAISLFRLRRALAQCAGRAALSCSDP